MAFSLLAPKPVGAVGQSSGPRAVAGTVLRYTALVIAAVLFLLPYYLILRNGLASEHDITSPNWTFFPTNLHWENLGELFGDPSVPMAHALLNSGLIAIVQTAGQLLLG